MQHQQTVQLEQQIDQIILNSSTETVLEKIVQALGEAFRADYCLVRIAADKQDRNQISYWCIDNNVLVPLQHRREWEQLASVMILRSEPLFIDDIQALETSIFEEWRHLVLPIRAVLEVPTWFQGNINGAIGLFRKQPYHWSELEQERALNVAASVAIAISQVVQNRLVTSLQQQVHTSAQYRKLLNQLAITSRSSLELNQVLNLAVTGTAQTLNVERGLLIMLKYVDPLFKIRKNKKDPPKAKATVVCEWLRGYNPNLLESPSKVSTVLNQSFWMSECLLCQQAFTNSNSVVINNEVNVDPGDSHLTVDQHNLSELDLATNIAPLFDLTLLPALVILPLESQGTVLGFLVLQHSCRLWHSEEIALLKMVSIQISTAIIQSQTLRQVQSLIEERTAQLQRSLAVQAKLYEKTRQQIDQLRQLNQLKDEFIDSLSHELNTPLTKMKLAICMLRQPGLPSQRQVKYLDILEQQCTQEIDLITDLLKLQELESHKTTLNIQTIDIKPLIHNLAQSFKEEWADKGLTISVDLPKPLMLQTDVDSLERILRELLTNAGKYSDPETTISLKATHKLNQVIFVLDNFGPGISSEDVTHIFDKFRRGQGVTQKAIQGTGLGLALVKCLVEHLNGTIDVSSGPVDHIPSHKTCFTLTLPQFFEHTKP